MRVQDDDGPAVPVRQALQAPEEINLLRRIQLEAEPAQLTKRGRLAEDERPRGPFERPAYPVPPAHAEPGSELSCIELHGGAAGDGTATLNDAHELAEEFRTRLRVGVHEHEPVACGRGRSGIARLRNLVD